MTDQQQSITVLLIFLVFASVFGLYTMRDDARAIQMRCIAIENKNRIGGVTLADKRFWEKHCTLHDLPTR